ncbi:hypothetical protein [Lysobacter auxotrophicus]|uniref:Diguanylate cyclase n=1 Tax=Lysobacter auxotrophicus TaxID=2992573 RepID=A0ABM8DCT1_9GAMM|nr:hypothetical protein [Lysobacter auxotrophicus]BDU16399.1 diguanylate cyclase [Lysobacter auxotrophicus]
MEAAFATALIATGHDVPARSSLMWGALALYWLWTIAGCLDFACHRATNLPATSGIAESRLHLVQLALCGGGAVLWLVLAPTAGLALLVGFIVVVHAWAGYRDTRAAFLAGRTISPIEQHIHSVLDVAPWIALAATAWLAWRAPQTQWGLTLRETQLSIGIWAAVLLPALVLCVAPALMEFRDALRVANRRRNVGADA